MEAWTEYRDGPSWLRRGVVVLVVGLLAWGVHALSKIDFQSRDPLARAIDRIVERAMDEGPIAGVSVVVSRGWRVVHAKGYGFADLDNRIPATPETVYRVGSITKQFTAAAVMRQVEEEAISLDAPVTDYLDDDLVARLPHLGSVTVAQLLSHTAGVTDYTMNEESWRVLGLEMRPREIVDYFDDAPLEFPPGSRFSYSNSGYVLLGLVLEHVTERPFGGLLNASIFVPAGLGSTSYCDDRRIVANRALGYDHDEGEFVHAPHVSMSQIYAAGAVCSSALDLARWLRTLRAGDVLEDESYAAMIAPYTLNDGARIEYGYGLSVGYMEGVHRVGHVGGFLGFMGQMAHYTDEDLTVIVLTNTEGAAAARIESEIARAVLELGASETLDLPLGPEELRRYVGVYDLGVTTVSVLSADGRLQVDVDTPRLSGRYALLYQGDGVFVAETDAGVVLTFHADEGGTVHGFELSNRGIVLGAERVSDPVGG